MTLHIFLIFFSIVLLWWYYKSSSKRHNSFNYGGSPQDYSMNGERDNSQMGQRAGSQRFGRQQVDTRSYVNAQDYQESSQFDTRADGYGPSSNAKEEYMTNKYNDSYQQAVASQPSASNYSEYMISTGLEAGVIASHNDFVDETQNKTTGASTESVFSHDESIVPSVGLRRRSAYIPVNPNSREVPSQTNEQLRENTAMFKYGIF